MASKQYISHSVAVVKNISMSEDAARSDTKGSFCNITSPTYMYFWDAEYLLLGDMSVQAAKSGLFTLGNSPCGYPEAKFKLVFHTGDVTLDEAELEKRADVSCWSAKQKRKAGNFIEFAKGFEGN